jgi:hypothetical protein
MGVEFQVAPETDPAPTLLSTCTRSSWAPPAGTVKVQEVGLPLPKHPAPLFSTTEFSSIGVRHIGATTGEGVGEGVGVSVGVEVATPQLA